MNRGSVATPSLTGIDGGRTFNSVLGRLWTSCGLDLSDLPRVSPWRAAFLGCQGPSGAACVERKHGRIVGLDRMSAGKPQAGSGASLLGCALTEGGRWQLRALVASFACGEIWYRQAVTAACCYTEYVPQGSGQVCRQEP